MTAAITLPAELVAEVTEALAAGGERLAAYQPHTGPGSDVLVLACSTELPHTGTVRRYVMPDPKLPGDRILADGCSPEAWALVGSVDGGPRPAVGARALVLECSALPSGDPGHVGHVGTVVDAPSGRALVVRVDPGGEACRAARWALLPAAADLTPGGSTEPPPGEASVAGNPHQAPAAILVDVGRACGSSFRSPTGVRLYCTYPPEHGPIIDRDGEQWDHGLYPQIPGQPRPLWRAHDNTIGTWPVDPPPAGLADRVLGVLRPDATEPVCGVSASRASAPFRLHDDDGPDSDRFLVIAGHKIRVHLDPTMPDGVIELRDLPDPAQVALADDRARYPLRFTLGDERDRYREHSVTLNTVAWRLAVALGDIPAGATEVNADAVDLADRLIAARDQLRGEVERLRAALAVCDVVVHRADIDASDAWIHAVQLAAGAARTDWRLGDIDDDSYELASAVRNHMEKP